MVRAAPQERWLRKHDGGAPGAPPSDVQLLLVNTTPVSVKTSALLQGHAFLSWACAAANLAMGTRKGEQLT